MNKPNNDNPIDRPIKDIIDSMRLVIRKSADNGKGQFSRDLEKLCVYAKVADDMGWGKPVDPPPSDNRIRDIIAGEDK